MALARRWYEADHHVDEWLLNQVSKHVRYEKLGPFSKDLGVSETEYQKIATSNIDRQIFKVLEHWYQRLPHEFSVKHLVGEIKHWQQEGYVDRNIWEKRLGDVVNKDVLEAAAVIAPPATSGGRLDISTEEIAEFQRLTVESLCNSWTNCLSNDWMEENQSGASSFPLDKYYIDLEIFKTVKGPICNTQERLNSIYQIFEGDEASAKNILMEGPPGVGKTSTIALLAMEWVKFRNGERSGKLRDMKEKMRDFSFLFTVRLRFANKTPSLADLVIAQHDRLKAMEIPPRKVQAILKGKTKHKVLLILDGYDEYKRGTNTEIDEAIESTIGNCFLLVTSRTGNYVTKRVRDKMAAEYTVDGFSEESIATCSKLYLGSHKLSTDMMMRARESGVDALLKVPIVLLMVCVSYHHDRKSLSNSKTGLLGTLFHLMMDRTTLKSFNEKSSKLDSLENLLYALGELSWKSLARETHQLLISKEELDGISPDIMKLGLLYETEMDVASVHERSTYVCFKHPLLQEYSGAYYIEKRLQEAPSVKDALEEFFPNWNDIERHREVVTFCRDLMNDPSTLKSYIHQKFQERMLNDHSHNDEDGDKDTAVSRAAAKEIYKQLIG